MFIVVSNKARCLPEGGDFESYTQSDQYFELSYQVGPLRSIGVFLCRRVFIGLGDEGGSMDKKRYKVF
jgi:hypothetical protein